MIQKTNPIRRWKQWLALPLAGVLVAAVACEKAAPPAAPDQTPVEISEANAKEMPNGFYSGDIPPPPPPVPVGEPIPPAPDPQVYTYVEQMPQMPGGGNAQAIMQYLQSHIKYSDALAANPKEGIVFVKFTVGETGEVRGAEVVKGLSPVYDSAVLDAVWALPRFIPGKQDNKVVAVSFTVPVRFVR